MNNFFATPKGAWGAGSVRVTTTGILIVVAFIVALLFAAAFLRHRNNAKKATLTTRQLVFSSAAIALATVCSLIKFANLPMGGSVTLLSMLFVTLIGYWYGPYVGIMTAVAYGLLQFVMEPIFYTLPQMFIDYPCAFGALGLSGFFSGKKHGLQLGYLAGVLGRYFFAVLSGVVFFGAYAPEGTPALLYSLGYNASYLVPEAVITIAVLCIPPVAHALTAVRKQALQA